MELARGSFSDALGGEVALIYLGNYIGRLP